MAKFASNLRASRARLDQFQPLLVHYGQKPDMALFMFAKGILAGDPTKVFNHGHSKRSFSYDDDIVEGAIRTLDDPPAKSPDWNCLTRAPATGGVAPYRLFNIGNEQPLTLLCYIEVLEKCHGRKAQMEQLLLQAGDLPNTEADVSELIAAVDYRPAGSVEEGVAAFVAGTAATTGNARDEDATACSQPLPPTAPLDAIINESTRAPRTQTGAYESTPLVV